MEKKIFFIVGMLFINLTVSAKTVGVIKLYKGKVSVKQSAKSRWVAAKVKMKLSDKAILKTGKKGMVQLQLKGGTIYKIRKNTKKSMKSILASISRKNKGVARAKLKQLKNKLGKGNSAGKGGVTAVAGVRGADKSKSVSSHVKSSELIWEE